MNDNEEINIENFSTEIINIDPEKQEKKRIEIIEKIGKLYDVIDSFRNGDLLVYNPNIFSKLTKTEFTQWVISNNKNLINLFN